MAENAPYLMYKDRPLVRSGNMLYYGNMSDEHVVMMQILNEKEENGIKVADRIQIQLLSTDPEAPLTERILKTVEKKVGLSAALEIADIWLSRIK